MLEEVVESVLLMQVVLPPLRVMMIGDSFGLRHVSIPRGANGNYGFGIKKIITRPPQGGAKLKSLTSYFVGDIIPGGNASLAEMHSGDRIVSINGVAVTGSKNADVLSMVTSCGTSLDILLIPKGEEFMGLSQQSQRHKGGRMAMSMQGLHSIAEHGELAYGTLPVFHPMVSQNSHSTSNVLHLMEPRSQQPRRASIDSIGSDCSLRNQAALKNYENTHQQASHTSSIKHSATDCPSAKPELNGYHTQPRLHTQASRRGSASTGDLVTNSSGYCTFARAKEHFPQKVLRPTADVLHRSSQQSLNNQALRAPVASFDGSSSPNTNSRNPEDKCKTSPHSKVNGNESSGGGVRFLPAYRGETVEEMLNNQSPRATWQPNTKYARSHSESRNVLQQSSAARNGSISSRRVSSQQTIGSRHSSYRGSPQLGSMKVYSSSQCAVPPRTLDFRKTNDGTHPRMSPMRATEQPTYYGQPIHSSSGSMYHPVRRESSGPQQLHQRAPRQREQHPSQQPVYYRDPREASPHTYTVQHGRRGRIASDISPQPFPVHDADVRAATSDNELARRSTHEQRLNHYIQSTSDSSHLRRQQQSMPTSGTYVASSSMTSLPQYAQLMNHTSTPNSQRCDSAVQLNQALVEDSDTRHSYAAHSSYRQYEQPHHNQLCPPGNRSCEALNCDVFDGDKLAKQSHCRYYEEPNSPGFNVSRQPSYLTAMHAPLKHKSEEPPNTTTGTQKSASQNNLSTPQDDNGSHKPITYRQKPSDGDLQAKIVRRTSYLMATSKPECTTTEDSSKSNGQPKYNIKKLKSFFGERTPSIKEAQEKGRQPSTPDSSVLPANLDVHRLGILGVKVSSKDGKKASDRSWKGMGAALCGHLLYLLKDKKENANMLTSPAASLSLEETPLSIKACQVVIAHGYTKRLHVFRLTLFNGSEYLLQANDHADMMAWIKSIMANSDPDDDSERLTSGDLIKRLCEKQAKQQPIKKKRGLSFKQQPGSSPSITRSGSTQKSDSSKKKQSGPIKQLQFGVEEPSGDFGIPLNECSPSHENEFIPLVVELCTKAIEDRGLQFVGIYRVPGNKAAVQALMEELNSGIQDLDNDKWRDMNVLSSLLKSFFRRLPDSLVTTQRYKDFIEVNRISEPEKRLLELKRLIKTLPDYNYETLRYLAHHLRNVSKYSHINKMETRNLAIVFGPTIVRSGEDVMSLMTDMSDQCRIIESIIVHCDWMFNDDMTSSPEVLESETSCTPISETMNNMSEDIAALANKTSSKSQLMSAFNSAANKKMNSKSSLGASDQKSKVRLASSSDDHGFKVRNSAETAARNMKIQEHEANREKELREASEARLQMKQNLGHAALVKHNSHELSYHHAGHPLQRRHSEESILQSVEHRGHLPQHMRTQFYSNNKHDNNHHTSIDSISDRIAPPLPARGDEVKPPLPPKPMQLYYARPTQVYRGQSIESSALSNAGNDYENFQDLKFTPALTSPPPLFHRGISVTQQPLSKSSSLPRRGSLDSMMDTYEQGRYSDSSTESEDGSDLLSSITATFDEKLKLLVDPKFKLDGSKGGQRPSQRGSASDSSSVTSSIRYMGGESPSRQHNYRTPSDRSRESLISGSKEQSCDSSLSHQDVGSSDRGFHDSTSSVGSAQHVRQEAKIGIASRIERKDMKPIIVIPSSANTKPVVVNAIGSVLSIHNANSTTDLHQKDTLNNNNSTQAYSPITRRNMSEEKKRIRRRHTVGGARDFEQIKDILAGFHPKENILNEAMGHTPQNDQHTMSAWQRLQPRDTTEPITLRDWIERERFRASSPELDLNATPNIMHLHRVGRKLANSTVLESNI